MKLLILLLFAPIISFSQVPDGTNCLQIKGVTFEQAVQKLLDNGYALDKLDKDFKTAKSEWKKLCNDCVQDMNIYLRYKDGSVFITGTFRSNDTSNPKVPSCGVGFPIEANSPKAIPKAFMMMEAYAKSLSSQISYLSQ